MTALKAQRGHRNTATCGNLPDTRTQAIRLISLLIRECERFPRSRGNLFCRKGQKRDARDRSLRREQPKKPCLVGLKGT